MERHAAGARGVGEETVQRPNLAWGRRERVNEYSERGTSDENSASPRPPRRHRVLYFRMANHSCFVCDLDVAPRVPRFRSE